MATPRSQQIDLEATQTYHVVSRCVRRSYLCGRDAFTGKNYDHRKNWIKERVQFLSTIFTIDTCVSTPMCNHHHLIVHIDAERAKTLPDEEVLERWAKLCPSKREALLAVKDNAHSIDAFNFNVEDLRKNLYNLSIYMQYLNQYIAKRANAEDEVTGRFWEGRFKSQALLDEAALLTAMVYVDLNPLRAKMVQKPEEAEFTSLHERISHAVVQFNSHKNQGKIKRDELKNVTIKSNSLKVNKILDSNDFAKVCDRFDQLPHLMPFKSTNESNELPSRKTINFHLSDYFLLIDEASRVIRDDKCGFVSADVESILVRLNLNQTGWLTMIKNLEEGFSFAVGSPSHLGQFNANNRKRSMRGVQFSKQCYIH